MRGNVCFSGLYYHPPIDGEARLIFNPTQGSGRVSISGTDSVVEALANFEKSLIVSTQPLFFSSLNYVRQVLIGILADFMKTQQSSIDGITNAIGLLFKKPQLNMKIQYSDDSKSYWQDGFLTRYVTARQDEKRSDTKELQPLTMTALQSLPIKSVDFNLEWHGPVTNNP